MTWLLLFGLLSATAAAAFYFGRRAGEGEVAFWRTQAESLQAVLTEHYAVDDQFHDLLRQAGAEYRRQRAG